MNGRVVLCDITDTHGVVKGCRKNPFLAYVDEVILPLSELTKLK